MVAERIAGKIAATLFARDSLVSIVDGRMADKAYRILSLIRAVAWDAPVELAFEEIAFAANSSRPQVIRHVKWLEAHGYIGVRRTHNKRNEYWAIGVTGIAMPRIGRGKASLAETPAAAQAPAVPLKPTRECLQCRKPRSATKGGICRVCVSQQDFAVRLAAARVDLGPDATPEQLAAHLKNARLAARIRRLLRAA